MRLEHFQSSLTAHPSQLELLWRDSNPRPSRDVVQPGSQSCMGGDEVVVQKHQIDDQRCWTGLEPVSRAGTCLNPCIPNWQSPCSCSKATDEVLTRGFFPRVFQLHHCDRGSQTGFEPARSFDHRTLCTPNRQSVVYGWRRGIGQITNVWESNPPRTVDAPDTGI